ncbi:gamma-glutamylcyclotransferase [uncultured Roseobacter sp.]|uniref:gamma-glutamylcyclotransferase n=1 Tax=uncultured Roseobacter sp. TaxID=114847 RepID=UPI0026232E16|nr:gamma-glutamylcyclotransferase [uncultured Roseobacter sp.]
MTDPYFFGYGSLVNTRSHDYPDPRPALLSGWRRAWVATPHAGQALLTGVPAPGHRIDGLIAKVPGGDWAALDAREAGYARHSAEHETQHDLPHRPRIAVYAVPGAAHQPRQDHVILLSYLDVVVQGFETVFGSAGVARFFETTDNWDTPVLNDRAAPRYPRAQSLTAAQTELVDDHLAQVGARIT